MSLPPKIEDPCPGVPKMGRAVDLPSLSPFARLVSGVARALAFEVDPHDPRITLNLPCIVTLPGGAKIDLPLGSVIALKGWEPSAKK